MMKKLFRLSVYSMPLVIVILLVVKIVATNTLASFGETVRTVDAKISRMSEENELLRQQVASVSALVAIAARAGEFGFVEPTKSQMMTIAIDQFPVALR